MSHPEKTFIITESQSQEIQMYLTIIQNAESIETDSFRSTKSGCIEHVEVDIEKTVQEIVKILEDVKECPAK